MHHSVSSLNHRIRIEYNLYAKRTQKERKEKKKKKEIERRQKSLHLHRAGEFYKRTQKERKGEEKREEAKKFVFIQGRN